MSLLVYGQFARTQRSAHGILKVRYIGMHVEHYVENFLASIPVLNIPFKCEQLESSVRTTRLVRSCSPITAGAMPYLGAAQVLLTDTLLGLASLKNMGYIDFTEVDHRKCGQLYIHPQSIIGTVVPIWMALVPRHHVHTFEISGFQFQFAS